MGIALVKVSFLVMRVTLNMIRGKALSIKMQTHIHSFVWFVFFQEDKIVESFSL